MTDLNKQLSLAKINIMTKPETVFLSTVCCSLPTTFNDRIPTACTDGKTIEVNPTFFAGLNKEEQSFLLAHETLHVVFMHMIRRGDRDPEIFNQAGDYVINDTLINQKFTMIKGGLYDPQYHGLTTEQVYDLIKDQPKSDNSLGNDIEYSNGKSQEQQEGNSSSQSTSQEVENDIRDILIRAAQQAEMKSQGHTVPESVKRYLDELSKPKVNWKVVLKRFMQDLAKSDYSWSKPNKRVLHLPMYLPKLISEDALSKVTFAIDTSGSISDNEFKQFISEVTHIFKMMKPKVIDLIQFDHELKYHQEIKSLQELQKVPFKGYGGTCPEVAIKAFMKTDSKALIAITDGEFHTGLPNPKRPVFWVVFNNKRFVPPYGRAIHFEV